jgi:hypothetical protein
MCIGYFREIPYLELSKLYLYIKDDVEFKPILIQKHICIHIRQINILSRRKLRISYVAFI